MKLRVAARSGTLALATLLLAACSSPDKKASDIFLIVVDTLRAQNLSLYGYDRETSPNLDRFAKDAVTYEDAITPGTWTVPAHASLFTGLMPSYHGAERVAGDRILATPVNPQAKMLAEILSESGWRTGAFLGNTTYLTTSLGFGRGFAFFGDKLPDNRAEGVVRSALEWLAESDRHGFVFMNILDPHEPYAPPPPFDTRFPGKIESYGDILTSRVFAGEKVTPEMRAHFISQYDGEVAYSDASLGKLFEGLKKLGRYDKSLIIVTADHGEFIGEHGLAGHGSVPYEPLIHVPLIVKYPSNRDAGKRIERRVSTLALFATVLEGAVLPLPDGVASVPVDQPHPVWLEDIDFAGNRVTVGYDGPWKMLRRVGNGSEETFLWNLTTDPEERRSVGEAREAAALRANLEAYAAAPRPKNPTPPPVVDPERERQLRALGYVR